MENNRLSFKANSRIQQTSYPSSSLHFPPAKKTAFLTEKNPTPFQKMNEAFNQLNSYIELLDDKIQKVLELREGEFMLAYRNHVKKVRQEMQEIRKKALNNANSSVNQIEKIQSLEKQLALFRQQSLRLFDKLNAKQKQLQQANFKISQLQTQVNYIQSNIKVLMKRNKYLQGSNIHNKLNSTDNIPIQSKINPIYYQILSKQRPFTTAIPLRDKRLSLRSRNTKTLRISETKNLLNVTTDNFTKQTVNTDLNTKIKELLGQENLQLAQKIIKLIQNNNIENNKNIKKYKSFTSQINKSIASHSLAMKSQMEQFFYNCIENVRKQIYRRNQSKSLNFYVDNFANLKDFKTVDYFRILQLLVSHQQIIKIIHSTIFGIKKTIKI